MKKQALFSFLTYPLKLAITGVLGIFFLLERPKKVKKDNLSLFLSFLLKFSIISVLGIFFLLIGFIFYKGILNINLSFFEWEYNSENISIMPAIINTLNMIFCAILIAMPVGFLGRFF